MTSFTSATLGEIRHPLNILKEFLATFNRRQKCKAAILSWLDGKHYYGNPWVRITFENLADILGYCRETISKHMRELIFDGLVEDKPSHRFPKDTASEYRLNLEKILATIDYSRCEKISVEASDISPECAKNSPTYNKTSDKLSENNNVGGEEKDGEPDWDTIASKAETWEQAQISRYLEESGEVDSNESKDSNGDEFRAEQVEVVTSSEKPKNWEIKEVCTELKRLRINPDPCLGVIKKYWGNVAAAIARVKEAIHEGWCDNPTGLFIASCKNGDKPKNTPTSEVSDWFKWARKERIVIAMSSGVVYTPDGEAVKIEEIMRRYPMCR
ncbi:MAG: helix-turn-helix domain-containing protein [Cyanobacteria bacterium P01_D01_bin.50]